MNPEERFILREHESTFVEKVRNFDSLLELLIESKVITDGIKDHILKANGDSTPKKELINIIAKRGPSAFKQLICCLNRCENEKLANDLIQCRPEDHNKTVQMGIYKLDFNREECYKMRSQPKGLCLIINVFDFKANTHCPRLGSDKDVMSLKKLFFELGYKIIVEENPTKDELINCLKEFAGNKEHSSCDSAIVFIMSHGHSFRTSRGVGIYCHDNEIVQSVDIIEMFSVSKCPLLASKPKMFYFQACRGNCFEFGVYTTTDELSNINISSEGGTVDNVTASLPANHTFENLSNGNLNGNGDSFPAIEVHQNGISQMENGHTNSEPDLRSDDLEGVSNGIGRLALDTSRFREGTAATSLEDVRTRSPTSRDYYYKGNNTDIIIFYSTQPGYYSLRDEDTGAWFVQEICKVYAAEAYKNNLMELMNKVMRNIEQKYSGKGMQLCHFENVHFSKKLYFNPGLYH